MESSVSAEGLQHLFDGSDRRLAPAGPSTIFVERVGDLLPLLDTQKTRIAAIGPITAATLHDYGFTVAVGAEEFTIPGLVDAIARA